MSPALWDKMQVAEYLKVSKATINVWVALGFIPYFRIGRLIRFNPDEIKDWIHTKAVKPATGEETEATA